MVTKLHSKVRVVEVTMQGSKRRRLDFDALPQCFDGERDREQAGLEAEVAL